MSTTIDFLQIQRKPGLIPIKKLVKKEDYSCHNCKFFTRAWIPRTGHVMSCCNGVVVEKEKRI